MKKSLLVLALLLSACVSRDSSEVRGPLTRPGHYTLVFADEFDTGAFPNRAHWAYDTYRNAEGWYNGEVQYYSGERAENARIENGLLVIEARNERLEAAPDFGGQNYTSARLMTHGEAAWTYGFFEVRAKLPCGRGAWPAIWTLAYEDRQGWPHDGEIDIMEHVGYEPGKVHATVHTGAFNHRNGNARSASTLLPDACSAFHRYQMHWTEDRITIGVDDRAIYRYKRNERLGRPAWPFDSPQYLLLNIAIGGWGGRHGIDDTIFPVRMEIDYVRVYQAPHEASES